MKFEIKGDKKRIKELLEKFVAEAREELEIQEKKAPIELPIEFAYYEDGDSIIFANTLPVPKLNFVTKLLVRKMEKNLKKYFETQGIKAEIKFLGE